MQASLLSILSNPINSRYSMCSFFHLFCLNRKLASLVVILNVAYVVLELPSVIIFGHMLDKGLIHRQGNALTWGILVILILTVMTALCGYLKKYYCLKLESQISQKLKEDIVSSFLQGKYLYIRSFSSGDLISRIVEDTKKVTYGFVNRGLELLKDTVLLSSIIILTFYLNRSLALWLWILPLIAVAIYALWNQNILKLTRIMQKKHALLMSITDDIIKGLDALRSYSKKEFLLQKFNRRVDEYEARRILVEQKYLKIEAFFRIMQSLPILIVWGYGGFLVLQEQLTVGTLLVFVFLIHLVIQPIENIFMVSAYFQGAKAALQRVQDIASYVEESSPKAQAQSPLTEAINSLELKDIGFSYSHHPFLNNINALWRKGDFIGIYSKSGSGKTTLAYLLLKLFAPQEGQLLINGQPIDAFEPGSIQKKMGIVFQNTFLFQDSLYENIKMHRSFVAHEDVLNSIRLAGVDEFININHRELYQVRTNLSGGQKQRIGIARALAANPDILICDEATAHLSSDMEESFMNHLHHWRTNKIVIMITHKKSLLEQANAVYHVDQGRLILMEDVK